MKSLTFVFSGYGGWDVLMGLLPKGLQGRMIARAFIRKMTTGGVAPDPTKTRMVVALPWGSYQIMNSRGKLAPCAREHTPLV